MVLAAGAWLLVAALPASAAPPPAAAGAGAESVLTRALAAMGGRKLLSGLHSLKLELRSVSYRIDDSERAEGPYWLNIGSGTRWLDLDKQRSRTEWDQASAQWPLHIIQIEHGNFEDVAAKWHGKWQWNEAAGPIYRDVALQPERILLTASGAGDLVSLPDRVLHAEQCRVLAFTYEGHQIRLYIDKMLYLPARAEMDGARAGTWRRCWAISDGVRTICSTSARRMVSCCHTSATSSTHAIYRDDPFGPPQRGIREIRAYWDQVSAGQRDIHTSYEVLSSCGNKSLVHWTAQFTRFPSAQKVRLDGIAEIILGEDGKASSFREWWNREQN